MTTNKMLYYQLKLAILNTKKQLSLTNYSDRWYLAGHHNSTGETKLSRSVSKTEMYEILYTMNQVFDSVNTKDQYVRVGNLSDKAYKYVESNLHNDSVPQTMEIIQ